MCPSYHSLFSRSVQNGLPTISEVPYSGFGYPLYGVSSHHPWKSLSTPNTLGIRPSKLSSLLVIEKSFRTFLPLLRFPTKPSQASYRRSSGLLPRKKPCSSTAPKGLVRVGANCSPGLSDLSDSQNSWPRSEASPFQLRPLALLRMKTSRSPLP
jgi:hypothetical protein